MFYGFCRFYGFFSGSLPFIQSTTCLGLHLLMGSMTRAMMMEGGGGGGGWGWGAHSMPGSEDEDDAVGAPPSLQDSPALIH